MTFFSLYKSKTYFRDNVNWVRWLKLSGQSIVVNSLDNIQNQSVSKASLTKLPVSFKRQIDIWVRSLKNIHILNLSYIQWVSWENNFLWPVLKRSIKCIYLCFMCGIPQVWFHTATFAVYYILNVNKEYFYLQDIFYKFHLDFR